MGTQQILLIVLSVVVVGIAVAVGITMFQNQAVNSARQSIMSDMNNFAAQAMAWYKMPLSMGGGGQVDNITTGGPTDNANLTDDLAAYLGFIGSGEGETTYTLENENATYTLDASGTDVTFTSIPKETALTDNAPALDVDLIDGTITPYPTGTGNTGT
jgi:type II secretory pathway pseudopilin PulG